MELFKPEPKKAEGIGTQTPKDLRPLKHRKLELVQSLTELTVEQLKILCISLLGKTPAAIKKGAIIDLIAEALNFSTVEQFEGWFFTFPELTQIIFYEAAFNDYVLIPPLEKKWGLSLVYKSKEYWRTKWEFHPEFQLEFLSVYDNYGRPITFIPKYLRSVLSLWLAPPPLSQLSACRAQDQTGSYNNGILISDAYPLLCDALQSIHEGVSEADLEKSLRSGLKKSHLNELRSSSGFLPFDSIGQKQAPDSVDLAARFILCMCNYRPKRPEDGQEGIRRLVKAFFNELSQYPKIWHHPDRAFLEYTICIDHLSRTKGNIVPGKNELPSSRKAFREILSFVAQDGGWFDADKLAEHIRIKRKAFSFSSLESSLKLRAEALEIDGLIYKDNFDEFYPVGLLYYYLLIRPLFKAYCYIFASLGLLEIVQILPPLARTYREKQYPVSPYDSLKAIRITDLGRWCLGLTSERPPKPSQEYHAIADRELFLVTIQGNSLERQLYLDKIGRRLGEDRWRISPGSFIAGCTNTKQIAQRVERFKTLIDKNPAPHWEQLFKKVIDRAGLFSKTRSDILVYDLQENQEILEELLRDPELKRLARRVEGRMLAVASKDQKRFFALMNEHGIACF